MTGDALHAQLGPGYRFDAEACELHARLVARARRPADVQVAARRGAGGVWSVTVCAPDRPGALSVIAGCLTARRLDIVRAQVFTVRVREPAEPAPGGRPGSAPPGERTVGRILDVFEVRGEPGLHEAAFAALRDDLAEALAVLAERGVEAARGRLIERVSEVVLAAEPAAPLLPVAVEVDHDQASGRTVLGIHAADTIGFLFEFTNALAMLDVVIERATIETRAGQVYDTFHVTDPRGEPIRGMRRVQELRVAAALIKQFTHLLPRSPDPEQALRQFASFARTRLSRPGWVAELADLRSDEVLRTLADLMGVSRFLWEDFLRMQHESLFPVVRDAPALAGRRAAAELRAALAGEVARAGAGAAAAALNAFKDREMFRIDLRHITGRASLREFAEELSDLGEAVIERAVAIAAGTLRARPGGPPATGEGARDCEGARAFSVLALGRLAGREMGYASDVELIVAYAGGGDAEAGAWFEELVRALLGTVVARQAGIFEIDLRLRPHGASGPLACSEQAFAAYFSPSGAARQFERMALVRMRPVAGDAELGARLVRARDAFVFSGAPLDREEVRRIRERQIEELAHGSARNAKYSPGALVDVEYFVQARQIEVGRDAPSVRVPGTFDAIDRLQQAGAIDGAASAGLRDSYTLLREVIAALRAVRGHASDLEIPPAGSREHAHLARRLGRPSPDALERDLRDAMAFARALWLP